MRSLMAVAVLSTVGGCIDPEGEYDAFVERRDRGEIGADAGSAGGRGGGADAAACLPSTVSGGYLLALSVTLAPRTPIVASVTLVGSDAPPEVRFASIQPLAFADRTTPAGADFSAGPFDVVDGRVVATVPGLRVAAEANPISGSEIAADVVLDFGLCAATSFLCGAVTGDVTEPVALPLEGSTFTMTPSDAADVEAVPIDCSGALADPP